MIIEIVDAREKIDELLPHIDEMVQEGLVTLEPVQVIKYRAGEADGNSWRAPARVALPPSLGRRKATGSGYGSVSMGPAINTAIVNPFGLAAPRLPLVGVAAR